MPSHKVLLIEDDLNDAMLIEHALHDSGMSFELVTARSREEFLAAWQADAPDIVMSDSRVPGLHHLEALDIVNEQRPGTPFLLCSGHSTAADVAELRRRGGIGWLPKDQWQQVALVVRVALKEASLTREHQRLEMELTNNAQQDRAMRILVKTMRELSTARSAQRIYEIAGSAARQLNDADGGTVVLQEGADCYYAAEDSLEPTFNGRRVPMSECIASWSIQSREPVVVADVRDDPRIATEVYRPTYIHSLAMVPIRPEDPLGAIGNYWATPHLPTTVETGLLQALAESTTAALENVATYQSLERRFQERNKALEELNRDLESFRYCVSHDLRAPLRHINAFSQLLLNQHARRLDAAAEDLATRILQGSQRMAVLIDGLLEFVRYGREGIEKSQLDMNALVNAELEKLQPELKRPIEFEIGALPGCWGDKRLLRHVWHNLIGNAVKYSDRCERPRVQIGANRNDLETTYFVRDNGIGFEMQHAGNLFSMFERLHTEKEYPGAGIGLAIVHRIIARHGGRVWAQARPNEGATFFFTLPARAGLQ